MYREAETDVKELFGYKGFETPLKTHLEIAIEDDFHVIVSDFEDIPDKSIIKPTLYTIHMQKLCK